MPKSTPDEVLAKMGEPTEVRNVAMVGASKSGKSCAVDCLGTQAGLVGEDKIGEALIAHVRQDERDKACTYKTNVNSMIPMEGLLVNVVDTPGHAEFSAEFNIAMPLVDGALVIVNGSEFIGGVLPNNRQMKDLVSWHVEPVLFCNKLDISLLVMQKSSDEIYAYLSSAVNAFNNTLDSCHAGGAPPT